jgi:hypothetical protein
VAEHYAGSIRTRSMIGAALPACVRFVERNREYLNPG